MRLGQRRSNGEAETPEEHLISEEEFLATLPCRGGAGWLVGWADWKDEGANSAETLDLFKKLCFFKCQSKRKKRIVIRNLFGVAGNGQKGRNKFC